VRHPVWLLGGPGAGAYEVGRALHAEGDPRGFVSVRQTVPGPAEIEERLRSALADDPGIDQVSLYVERIERQPASVQERLLRWSTEGAFRMGQPISVRLLAQSDEGSRGSELLPPLRHRLSTLMVPLPSLSTRRAEIPAIAAVIAAQLCEDLGLAEPPIDEDALRRLAERDWPGNLDELTAVISRGLIAAEGQRIATFEMSRASRQTPSFPAAAEVLRQPVTATASKTPANGPEIRELELIVAELAHELKNPMVTIKTFSENLEQLLNDPGLRDKFVGLTRDAIDRMDGFLEELLRFSRYAEPKLQNLALTQALKRALDGQEGRIRDRIKTNALSAKHVVRVDEDQVAFALKSLIRGLSREIPVDAPISVELSPSGELTFHCGGGGGMQQKLHGALDQASNGNVPWSLDLMMAEALIRRNGGSSRIVREQDQLQVRVALPSPERGLDGR
jgi:transcriptional regulator of acetoin/glycerol metabolism